VISAATNIYRNGNKSCAATVVTSTHTDEPSSSIIFDGAPYSAAERVDKISAPHSVEGPVKSKLPKPPKYQCLHCQKSVSVRTRHPISACFRFAQKLNRERRRLKIKTSAQSGPQMISDLTPAEDDPTERATVETQTNIYLL
jgi:hypothetical protein